MIGLWVVVGDTQAVAMMRDVWVSIGLNNGGGMLILAF